MMPGNVTTMAYLSHQCPITDEEKYILPLIKIIASYGQELLYQVFRLSCPLKSTTRNLKEHLTLDLPEDKRWTNRKFKDVFNKTQIEQILANPACDEFDVTGLYDVIRSCSSNLAEVNSPVWHTKDDSRLEYHLWKLKFERNELFHKLEKRTKEQMLLKIEDLRKLLVKIVDCTGAEFNIDAEITKKRLVELNEKIDRVRDQPLTEKDILQYRTLLWEEYVVTTLKSKGAEELKEVLKKVDFINPVNFKAGFDSKIKLTSVFSELKMVHSVSDHCDKEVNIGYKSVLQNPTPEDKGPRVILVKGMAGSGKTTLTKWLMLQWTQARTEILGLAEYDLVVPLECKNRHVDSLAKLFEVLLPKTHDALGDGMVRYIHGLKILFIIDALDERNKFSGKVVREMLENSKNTSHTILCTSRPEKTEEFLMNVPSEYQKYILKIMGISPRDQPTFARNYHDQLIALNKSKGSSDDLVLYLKNSSHLQDIYRFPLNLVLLVYLWAYLPEEVNNVTTVTELYKRLYELLELRLSERVSHRNGSDDDDDDGNELEYFVEKFKEQLCMEALISLSLNQYILQYPSEKRLKDVFHTNKTLFKEVASVFLSFKDVKLTELKTKKQLSFPHKDSHDYFAAQGVLLAIRNQHHYCSLRKAVSASEDDMYEEYKRHCSGNSIIRHVLQVLSKSSLEICNYQNMLKHLAGLIVAESEEEQVVGRGEEVKKVVKEEVMELLKESGVMSHDQWLDILAETKCDSQIGRYIAKCFFKRESNLLVKSTRVAGYASLVTYLSPNTVTLDIDSDPRNLPHLKHLLEKISEKDCSIEMKLWHHYLHPKKGDYSDSQLDCLLHHSARCRVDVVLGHLSGTGSAVNLRLGELHVVLSSDQQATRVTSSLLQQPHKLKEVRVMPGVSVASLQSLPPDGSVNWLDLTPVTIGLVKWGCQVARSLTVNSRLSCVRMPDCNPGAEVGLLLEEELSKAGISVEEFTPFSYLQKAEEVKNETEMLIRDGDVEHMKNVMAFASPKRVIVDLIGDPADLPHLGALLKLISEKDCSVEVKVWHHYTQPMDIVTTDDLISCLFSEDARCQVDVLLGHLSGSSPAANVKLREIHVVLSNDQQAACVTSSLLQKSHRLKEIRLMPDVAHDSLHPLPHDGSEILLDLSQLTSSHVKRGCQVAQALASRTSRLSCVRLPDCSPSAEAGLLLEKELNKMGISVEEFTPFSYLQKAERVKNETEMYIKDGDVEHMKDVMVFANPKYVTLDFVGDPDNLPHLDPLLKLISEKECTVEVKMWHHFTQPSVLMTTDTILTCLLAHPSRCQIDVVLGHLSGAEIPAISKLRELHVVLTNDQQAAAVTSGLLQQPHALKVVRVMPGVSADVLHHLPCDGSENLLDFSLVTTRHVGWGCQVAQALYHKSRLNCVVRLPDCTQGAGAGMLLEEGLDKAGISVTRYEPFSYLEKAKQIRDLTTFTVKDSNVEEILTTIIFAHFKNVTIELEGDPNEIPRLKQLLSCISQKECNVQLKLWKNYTSPHTTGPADALLMHLLHQHTQCRLQRLHCHVTFDFTRKLPSSLTELWIAVHSNHHIALLTHLHSVTLPHLMYLHVHIGTEVSPVGLPQLPKIKVHLDVADVRPGREKHVCKVIAALQPPRPYVGLWFPRASLEPQGWVTVVELLISLDVRVKDKEWGIMVPISTPDELVQRLDTYTKSKLGAVFKKFDFSDHW